VNVQEIVAQAQAVRYIRSHPVELDILILTKQVVKLRLHLSARLFIQVYRNDRYDTTNFALIFNGQRLYARDALAGKWHRHPLTDPSQHDKTAEGQRPVTFEEFLNEVGAILAEQGLQ
jgi:hypothetical protein